MRAAMILCAGLGTRLRPLTDWLAKPMVPIGDRPAVAHVASRLREAGYERLVINAHHRPDDLRGWAGDVGASVSEEPELLGTAGGVHRAAALLGEGDVLVWNGDILAELDPGALTAAHGRSGAAATLAVVPRAAGEGNVGLGEDGRIVRLRREAFGRERSSADFVGIHVLGGGLRRDLPTRGCLVGDVYIPALRRGAGLAAHVVTTPFVDVGSLAEYVAANRAWLAARGLDAWVGPGAAARASVHGSVVGAGARVDADAIRCVVWPGAHVRDAVADAVVTARGVVAIP
jgi:mannose-1-phosphate guanylyltransferase